MMLTLACVPQSMLADRVSILFMDSVVVQLVKNPLSMQET